MREGFIEIRANSYYGDPGVRQICHEVKQNEVPDLKQKAIEQIAENLVKRNFVKLGDVLIPAPQHTGDAEYTKEIAELISGKTGAVVADVLKCTPHFSLYKARKEGRSTDLRLYLTGKIPKGRNYFFIDNVISTGQTFTEANRLLQGKLKPLVYAVDETKSEELRNHGLIVKTSVIETIRRLREDQQGKENKHSRVKKLER